MEHVEDNVVPMYPFLRDGEGLVGRRLYQVPLECLSADPNQPRKYFDDAAMGELVRSIEKHGVLQPVMFRRDEDASLTVISGERRFRAALELRLESIPAIFNDSGNNAEIALVENLLRENLNPIEEAEALQALKKESNYTNVQICEAIGKAESTISEILSLNKLPGSIKDECRNSPNYARRGLVEIAKAGDEKAMLELFERYKKRELGRDAVREARGEAGPKAMDWKKTLERFGKKIEKIDFDDLGDQRRAVVMALQGLAATIERVLPVEGG